MSATGSRCYLGLGSNQGEREGYLRAALERLAATPGVRVLRVSSLFETTPWGVTDQPAFLNAVALLQTDLSPLALLARCQEIERELGRERGVRWGPRTVDVDLLLWPGVALDTPELVLPHPRLLERQFVLVPLAEIAPELPLPDGRTAREAAEATDPSVVWWGEW